MEEHRKEVRGRFKVSGETTDGKPANLFEFFALKRDFVENWVKGVYGVAYKGVPVRLFKSKRSHL
jgi:hypothetical protein